MFSAQHSEMGFSITVPFQKPNRAFMTPPTSPQSISKELKRQASRFRLPKIFKRSPTIDSGHLTEHMSGHQNLSGCLIPPRTLARDQSGLLQLSTTQAVQHSVAHCLPSLVKQGHMDGLSTLTAPRKLRKMPKSLDNLRAIAGRRQASLELTQSPADPPALLPSPVLSGSEDISSVTETLAFRNPRAFGGLRGMSGEVPYEFEGIVAGYCEDVFEATSQGFGDSFVTATPSQSRPSTPPSQQHIVPPPLAETRLPPTSNMSATLRSPKRERSSSLSSEATWMSKSFSPRDLASCIGQLERIKMNEKRLTERSRRCCHLVQGSPRELPASWTGERTASYATVIKPGKANDIWVPRSSGLNCHSPPRTNGDGMADEPKTPEKKLSEVSAFSPWESPVERRFSTPISPEKSGPLRKVATLGNLRRSYKEFTPTRRPLFPSRKDSLEPIMSLSTSTSTATLISERSDPGSLDVSPRNGHHSKAEQRAWRKCEKLAQVLDGLEQSIDEFPNTLLQLDSPVILQIRTSQSLDELHIERLRRIFPNAEHRQLSALAATLTAQSHLMNLSPIAGTPGTLSKYSHLAASSNESLSNMPTKAITTLGICMANVTSVQERERALRKRAKVVEVALHVVAQQVMTLVCGRFEDVLWRSLRCLVETVEQGW